VSLENYNSLAISGMKKMERRVYCIGIRMCVINIFHFKQICARRLSKSDFSAFGGVLRILIGHNHFKKGTQSLLLQVTFISLVVQVMTI